MRSNAGSRRAGVVAGDRRRAGAVVAGSCDGKRPPGLVHRTAGCRVVVQRARGARRFPVAIRYGETERIWADGKIVCPPRMASTISSG